LLRTGRREKSVEKKERDWRRADKCKGMALSPRVSGKALAPSNRARDQWA